LTFDSLGMWVGVSSAALIARVGRR